MMSVLSPFLPLNPKADLRQHIKWAEAFLEDGNCVREAKWTQSIAIGSQGFVEKTRNRGTDTKFTIFFSCALKKQLLIFQ
jgi:hypothetical protein